MITQISSSAVAAISISNHVKLPMHVLQTVNIIEPAALWFNFVHVLSARHSFKYHIIGHAL